MPGLSDSSSPAIRRSNWGQAKGWTIILYTLYSPVISAPGMDLMRCESLAWMLFEIFCLFKVAGESYWHTQQAAGGGTENGGKRHKVGGCLTWRWNFRDSHWHRYIVNKSRAFKETHANVISLCQTIYRNYKANNSGGRRIKPIFPKLLSRFFLF